jgi:hypothetical protein
MMNKTLSLAFAAGCFVALGAMVPAQAQYYPQQRPNHAGAAQMVTNGPQSSWGDHGGWSARQNVVESRQYDRLLQSNLAFRHARERHECSPISDQQLRGQCFASFRQYEPVPGRLSYEPSRNHHHRVTG